MPADSNRVVQGLWIGPELSLLEQLSIASVLSNDHEYHLYVYDEVRNVPPGTLIKDGNEILAASRIFQYKHSPSYAGFANFFRYKLLLERGGWWADMDTIFLRPFDFAADHVFATEIFKEREVVSSGIIKAPIGSKAMEYAWNVCQNKNPDALKWGETGSRLISEAVSNYSLENFVVNHEVFCPVAYQDWHTVLEPDPQPLKAESYAIHLWNEKWRESNQDKNLTYPLSCIYEQLKRRYLPALSSRASHF